MNITPFYELRQRLYAAAAAGCQTVPEDFRLKKAYEAFEPLSAANKAFAKLYALCGRLFTSDNAPETLADCIALADALAVTQGTFADNSETAETVYSFDEKLPEELPYSAVTAICEKIEKCSQNLDNITADEVKLLSDPRVLDAFIKACGKSSIYLDGFAEHMYDRYGKALVPLMKSAVDISDTKSSGNIVGMTVKFAGSEETEWYLSIAENEEAEQNVRIAAVEALGLDRSNAPKLAELYKTQKGKLKNAALDTLVGIDCPEAEEVMAKLLEKYKPSCDAHIAKACGKNATDFAVGLIKSDFDENGSPYADKERNRKIREYAVLLSNKPNADEGFLRMANCLNSGALDCVLINNLREKNIPEFRALIHRLYSADNDVFFKAEFFAQLIEDPENAVGSMGNSMFVNKARALEILSGIYYSYIWDKYCVDWRWAGILGRYPALPICDELPQPLYDLIFDKSCDQNDMTYQTAARIMLSLLSSCSWKKSDYERLRRSAVEFAISVMSECPNAYAERIITGYCSCGDSFDCRGLFTKWVMAAIDNGKESYPFPVYIMEKLPMSDSEKIKEMNELLEKLTAMKGKVSDSVLDRQIWYIKEYLEKNK